MIITVHELDWQTEKWKRFAKGFLRFCEYSAIYFPHETIVVSKTLKDYFKRKFGKECTYIPNGINISKLKSAKLILNNDFSKLHPAFNAPAKIYEVVH